MILKQINPLSDVDICFVERKEMIEYVSGMKNLQTIEKVANFHYLDRLGPLEEDWFMLMHNLLQFNPYLRWSASECLNLDIFRGIRNEELEQKPAQKISLDIDSDKAFDYLNGKSTIYFLKDYLNMIDLEVEMTQLYS